MGWFGEWLGMPGAHADLRPEVLEMFWQAWKGVQVEQQIWTEPDG